MQSQLAGRTFGKRAGFDSRNAAGITLSSKGGVVENIIFQAVGAPIKFSDVPEQSVIHTVEEFRPVALGKSVSLFV